MRISRYILARFRSAAWLPGLLRGKGARPASSCLRVICSALCLGLYIATLAPVQAAPDSTSDIGEQPATPAGRCYDPANVGTIGKARWPECAGKLIVSEAMLRSAYPINGGQDRAITHSTGVYTFGNGPKTIFTGQVTNMSSLFQWSPFNSDISHWETSRVTTMASMFEDASSFNKPIGTWNVSRVKTMRSMFKGASSFNQPIQYWSTSNVTDMGEMFNYATSFNQNVGFWDVSKVKSMDGMFFYAVSFNSEFMNWNTSSVTTMENMFAFAFSFNQYIGYWNVASVENMNSMFMYASSFNQPLGNLPYWSIRGWNTANVISMDMMFYGATSFLQDLSNWCVTKVPYPPFYFDPPSNPPHYNPNWGSC